MRWRPADDGNPALFSVDDLLTSRPSTGSQHGPGSQHGTGRLSGLEFLPVTARTILNPVHPSSRMPFRWTINVYRGCAHACTYCFARPTHEYLGLNLGEDFDRKIVVKVNAVEKLRAELSDPRWAREPVAMGTNTDPYQRAEARFRLTRGVLDALVDYRTPFSILTKAPLVTRDLDLLTRAQDPTVNFSIATLDEQVWRATEPGTPHPRRRLMAMRTLADAGIDTGALIAPVMPGLSDRPDQLAAVAAAIRAAGGTVRGVGALHLKPGVREHLLAWLAEYDPPRHQDYLRRYADTDHAPQRYVDRLRELVEPTRPDHMTTARPPLVG